MHTIFRTSSSQYSRRLLSILAQQNQQTNNSKQCCDAALLITTLPDKQQHFAIVQLHKKKCGAHMHAHHLSQLSSPIFTSVVVYSRTSHNQPQKQKKVVLSLLYYFCFEVLQ